LWNGVRLLVVDTETTNSGKGLPHRIVSIAVVVVEGGRITDRWHHKHVNPHEPIHPRSTRVHGIEDKDVKAAPDFAAIVAGLDPLLVQRPGERLVLVAHQARFDVPILRDEMGRTGRTIPSLPVLDTMNKGLVHGAAKTAPASGSLADLVRCLGIKNAKAHSALGDAVATAEAVIALLNRAADNGHTDLDVLLAAVGTTRSRSTVWSGPYNDDSEPREPEIPEAHVATHGLPLPANPGKRVLARWLAEAFECARLRCPDLADRIATAEMPTIQLRAALLPTLRLAIGDKVSPADNASATATLLGAMLPLLPAVPESGDAVPTRAAALDFERDFGPSLDGLRRCLAPLVCPDCLNGDSCPLDGWRLALAPAVLGRDLGERDQASTFFRTNGASLGSGFWKAMRRDTPALADAALRLVLRYWVAEDQQARADMLARVALEMDCHDPEIAAVRVAAIARGGRQADLEEARRVCEAVLERRSNSTEEGWQSLASRSRDLKGRIARGVEVWETGPGGMKVPKRRHYPREPRLRPARFRRTYAE
jgi:DNA polymerase III epsilon subunit-like protein